MMDYLLSNRMCVLEGAMMMVVGYQCGNGDLLSGVFIAVASIFSIAALDVLGKNRQQS